MFANEWFPIANVMGLSWEEFWHTNPYILKMIFKGHQEKLKEHDYLEWLSNQYTLSATSVAVEHNLAGRKARSKYIKKPLLQEFEEQNKPMPEEELQRQRELFVAKLQVMKTNFELNHKK